MAIIDYLKIDDHRRIIIPSKICIVLGLHPGDFLSLSIKELTIDCLKMDNQRRITIPKKFCDMLKIKPGDRLSISINSGKLTLSQNTIGCCICGSIKGPFSRCNELNVCYSCIETLIDNM